MGQVSRAELLHRALLWQVVRFFNKMKINEYILKVKQYKYGKEPKCVECNWNSCVVGQLKDKKTGTNLTGWLCGSCLMEMLYNWKAIIKIAIKV